MGVCEAQRLLRVEMSPPPLSSSSSSPPPPRWSPLLVTQITCRPGAIRRARRRRLSCPLLLASDRPQVVLVQLVQRGHRQRAGETFTAAREKPSSCPPCPPCLYRAILSTLARRRARANTSRRAPAPSLPVSSGPALGLAGGSIGCRQLASTTLECRGLLRSAAARAAEGRLHVAQRPRAVTPTAQPRRPNPGASGTLGWERSHGAVSERQRTGQGGRNG